MDQKRADFPRFPDLPFELRRQIWEKAMPAHGIYLADCDAVLADRDDDQAGFKALWLALRPAPAPAHHKLQDRVFGERFSTQIDLLATCVESRAVVCRRFPDTIGGFGPRFNFRHDLIYVASNFLHQAGNEKPSRQAHLEFGGGFNKFIDCLALHCRTCISWSYFMREPLEGRRIGIGFNTWAKLSCEDRLRLAEIGADWSGGLTCFASEPFSVWMGHLARSASLLRPLIVDDLEVSIHRDMVDKVVAGYPKLKDSEELKMVHVSREVQWLCNDVRPSGRLARFWAKNSTHDWLGRGIRHAVAAYRRVERSCL